MNNKSNSKNQPLTVDDIINEIKQKSSDGDYIYRGERKNHKKVSSALYREYIKIRKHIKIDVENFDLTIVEKEMLKVAKKHIGGAPKRVLEDFADVRSERMRSISEAAIVESLRRVIAKDEEDEELEILTELQHYGGKTNLIDFTTDFLIAIFFACSGEPKKDGRIIVLEQTKDIKDIIIRPQNPQRRVVAQKSVFLQPPKGFICVPKNKNVRIPFTLKRELLMSLRQYHGISTETIYNDIHGFIRNQDIQRNAYIQLYLGMTFQDKGYNTETNEESKMHYEKAIRHYDEVIDLNPEIGEAHGNRGACSLYLEKWDEAREYLTMAKDLGVDLISGFRNDYEDGVAEFKKKTGLTMPQYLAEMLGG